MARAVWAAAICLSAWRWVEQRTPWDCRDGKEWPNWNEGVIKERAPKRAVACAACGQNIPAGEVALYCLDANHSVDPWAPLKRFIHRQRCIQETP
jgi:hypothetical protein